VIPRATRHADPSRERWVTGDNFGLPIPADAEALLAGGTEFLTAAFRAGGGLDPGNSVAAIVESAEFSEGGAGKKLLLTVAYERSDPALPERLFVKFSRNFDDELRDSARDMMISEVNFALLSRGPDFPVKVPRCLFADVEAASATGLLVTERIPYGRDGTEPSHPKCMDYLLSDPVEHYRAIMRDLGRLAGAHRAGRLAPEFDVLFPYDRDQASAMFGVHAPEGKLVQWAHRMFDFVGRYPHLFPERVRDPALREPFLSYIADVVRSNSRIREILSGNPGFVAFAHWNANIDNCWFERDARGVLQCGFIDWANAGPISLAQAINGAISAAESYIWAEHLDELLGVFTEAFAAQGAPRPDVDELRLHVLLLATSSIGVAMGAPVAIAREIDDIDAITGPRDAAFRHRYNARVLLHMMTNLLENWQALALGELIRHLDDLPAHRLPPKGIAGGVIAPPAIRSG
jgi:hypothetical protein